MTFIEALNGAVVLVGVPTIAGVLVNVGKKLQKLEDLDEVIEKEIKPDLQDVRERFAALEGGIRGVTQSKSPISLTEKGKKMLHGSGMKEYVDNNKEQLMEACSQGKQMETAYDIQEAVFDYFDAMDIEPEYEKRMKEYAYQEGTSVELVRRTGAIYFRDICLEHFQKDGEELDYENSTSDEI